jgi:formylglycine-generating enzyme required for sulfatase activity
MPGPDSARWAWIPPGTFTMDSPITEYDRSENESPQTVVTLSKGCWIERYEVTQGK